MIPHSLARAITLTAAIIGVSVANASVIATHHECENPLSEGWDTLGSQFGVTVEPVCADVISTWRIDDNSTGGSLFYHHGFNAARTQLAMNVGWNLSARLLILDSAGSNHPFDTTHALNFRTGDRGFDLYFSLQGTDTVRVWALVRYDIGEGALAAFADVPVDAGSPFIVQMIYDPGTATADIYVDGEVVISGYIGVPINNNVCCLRSVTWGATSTSGTGESRWMSVQFAVNCDIPAGDITGEGQVDLTDLATLLVGFGLSTGQAGYSAAADIDGDGTISLVDLATLLTGFGGGCQ